MDNIEYDMDSPRWYWKTAEWNMLRVNRAITRDEIKRLSKLLALEEYPSCNSTI